MGPLGALHLYEGDKFSKGLQNKITIKSVKYDAVITYTVTN